jgi:DNA-binding CsgD family transcriptional regulator
MSWWRSAQTSRLDKGPSQVLIRAALATAHALRITGRSEDALAVLNRATEAMGVIGQEAISLSERVLVATRCSCLVELGRLGETLELIRSAQADSIDDFGLATTRLGEAMVLTMQGHGPAAMHAATIAHRSLLRLHADGAPRWSLSALSLAQSLTGRLADAAETLTLLATDDHPATMFDGLVWLAKARERAGAGFPADARTILAEGIRARRSCGDAAGEGHLLYELARLNDPQAVVARLAELAEVCQGELFSTRAAHIAAMVNDDALGLISASRRFAAMPAPMFAAEAASQAADAARRAGDQRAGNRYASEALMLRDGLDMAAATSLSIEAGPVPLTRREREIALLAVQGLASKAIGQRLYISARTAETHLAKVYDKLGIRSRGELAGAIDGRASTAGDGSASHYPPMVTSTSR